MSDPLSSVLDASAVLALLHGEEGAEVVEGLLEGAAISAVNWSEVCQRSLAREVEMEGLRTDVEALGVAVLPFEAEDAERAAKLWPLTREVGLSLGDRACLALAIRSEVPAVTADRTWLGLDLGVDVRAIR